MSNIGFDIEEAIRLFEATPSWRAVARKLDIHPYSVKAALEPLGYKTKQSVGRTIGWDIEKAMRLRQEEKLPYYAIAERMGVAVSTVQRALTKRRGKGGGLKEDLRKGRKRNED